MYIVLSSYIKRGFVSTCVRAYVRMYVTNFTNRYKTANNGRILDFKVSIEVYGHSASNYHFRILKFGLVWQPSLIFGQFWSILQTCIKRLIMDWFLILRCLQKRMDILLQTIILEFSNLVWFGGHLGFCKIVHISAVWRATGLKFGT